MSLLPQHFLLLLDNQQSLASYLAGQIAQFGGADWPLNDAAGLDLVADNRANSEALGANVVTNPTLAGNPITGWTEIEASGGVVTPLEPGAEVNTGATGGSAGTGLTRDGDIVQGKTYTFTVVIPANVPTTTGRAYYKTGNGVNIYFLASGFTGTSVGRLVADSGRIYLAVENNVVVRYTSVQAQRSGDLDLAIAFSGVTRAQAGEGGVAASAMDFNGANGMLYLPAQTAINGMTNFVFGGMINPDATGANDRLLFKNGEIDILLNADGTVSGTVNYSSTNATFTTNEAFTTGSWQGWAVGISSVDNLLRFYRNGVECTYSAQVAGVGTRVSNTNQLQFFKNGSTDGFDGKAQKNWFVKTAPTAEIAATVYALRNA